MATQTIFRLEDLLGRSNLGMSPKLKPEDIADRCCKLGHSMILEPANIEFLPVSELRQILAQMQIKIRPDDEITETLSYFGIPLDDRNYDSIADYLKKSREIVCSELGAVPDFEVTLVDDKGKDYEKEPNKKSFLCSSLYQGIMVHMNGKERKKAVKIPLVRTSPYNGVYKYHGDHECEYLLFCLDENLLIASFSEPIHALASRITKEYSKRKSRNLKLRTFEETFVEGVAQHLFNKYRNFLGVPRNFVLNPADDGIYSLVDLSNRWVDRNGLKPALELYRENPLKFIEAVK